MSARRKPLAVIGKCPKCGIALYEGQNPCDGTPSLSARVDALTAERDALAALLGEARDMLSEAVGVASSYYSDDQVGCLCMEECYCKAGSACDLSVKHPELAARITAALARIDAAGGRRG